MKIVFNSDSKPLRGFGTKVFTDSGEEIENVTGIKIEVTSDDLVYCQLDVLVTSIEGLENLRAIVELDNSIIESDDSFIIERLDGKEYVKP